MPTKDTSLKAAEWDFVPPEQKLGVGAYNTKRDYRRNGAEVKQAISRYIKENPLVTSTVIASLFGVHEATVRKWFPGWIERRKEARGE